MSDDAEDEGVKRLTIENWVEPDEISLKLGDLPALSGQRPTSSGAGWAEHFLSVRLAPSAPVEIREMWSVAQGVLCYGWFYYPLYAIGEHQLRRIADAAMLHRYKQAAGPPNKKPDSEDGQPTWPSFKRRIEWLIEAGVIPQAKADRWDVIRDLRNETTHASIRHIAPPNEALRVLDLLAAEIDALFADDGSSTTK